MKIELIDRIYESSFVPELWPGVLDELAQLTGSRGGLLFSARDRVLKWTASVRDWRICRSPSKPMTTMSSTADAVAWEASYGTYADLLLAFWPSIGLKPGNFMTVGMNEKRAAWFYRVPDRVVHPA